jgi:hypothetical protein
MSLRLVRTPNLKPSGSTVRAVDGGIDLSFEAGAGIGVKSG